MKHVYYKEVRLTKDVETEIILPEMINSTDTVFQIDYSIQKNELNERISKKINFKAGSSKGFYGKTIDLNNAIVKFDMVNNNPNLFDVGDEYSILKLLASEDLIFFLKVSQPVAEPVFRNL